MIDIEAESRQFAAEVAELLNRTVTDGIRLSAVIARHGATTVHVGRGIGRQDFHVQSIPITLGYKAPTAHLYAAYILLADPEGQFLAVSKSQYGLYLDDD